MRQKILNLIKHPLISGSAILVVGSLIANIFNYLFNLSMGRLLSPADYGILASIIAMINIILVLPTTITIIFTKFSASYAGQGKEELLSVLLRKGTISSGIVGLFLSIVYLIFSPQISNFLHIQNITLIYIVSIVLFFNFLSAVANGALQGLLKFFAFSVAYSLSTFSKFILGVFFVLAGLKVLGSVFAIVSASILGYVFAAIPLLKYFLVKKEKNLVIPNLNKQLFTYGVPVLLAWLGITSITYIDTILVKHFFAPIAAGQYAALSLMGRTIFFIVSPIVMVFFPLIAQKKERKEDLLGTILLSVFLVGVPVIFLSAVFYLFPGLIIRIFFPAEIYKSLAVYLGPFSIFIILYTFSWLLNSYYLSVGKLLVFVFTLAAAVLEVLLIIIFHQNIQQIINNLIIVTFLLLIGLLVYYPHKT